MASLDTLPPDQRAVLQLVLQRGRSYDEIAQLLSMDSVKVRERALSALEALGPGTRVTRERREEIGDYLLAQLPSAAAERARDRISQAAGERAWARVVASELAPLASSPLPEIPLEPAADAQADGAPAADESEAAPTPADAAPVPATAAAPEPPLPASEPVAAFAPSEPSTIPGAEEPTRTGLEPPSPPGDRPSSRRGGAILLAGGAIIAIAVVVLVIILVAGGGSKHKAASTSTTAASASTTTSSTSTSSTPTAQPIAQVNLVSPTHSKKIAGVAEIIKQGTKTGLVIVAQGVPANSSHDAYAVWLYNSQSDNHILGFVNPGVKTDGKLQTAGPLPANVSHFKQLLVTLETQAKPHGPGKVVLEGNIALTQ
jgi:Anti-sigma-K factor rskA, C-terminal/Sigma-70, region 4